MTRSLVVRIALVITVVVWGSIAVSSLFTSNKFRQSVEFRIEERMRQSGELVLKYIAQAEGSADADLQQLLSLAAQLGRNSRFTIYDMQGGKIQPTYGGGWSGVSGGGSSSSGGGAGGAVGSTGAEGAAGAVSVEGRAGAGGAVGSTGAAGAASPAQQPSTGSGFEPDGELVARVLGGELYATQSALDQGEPAVVGLPFQWREEPHALFVQPFLAPQIRDFEFVRDRFIYSILAISAILVLIASIYLVRPLRKINEATRRLAAGDFTVRLDIRQRDELGTLARSINHMADELGKMESVRQEFVANVSHDIRTPLTSIRGFTRMLENEKLSAEERKSYLEIIEKESERLSRLSENLLKLASLDARQYPYRPAAVQLDEQLRRVVLALEPLWEEKRLQLDLDLPKAVVTADEDALNQVWTNLLHNSIKFTPPGGTVTIRLEQAADHVTVAIADTGIGISEENRRQVFERFFKADSSRGGSGYGGSGLGLAIAAKMAELHGGSILCESEPGIGTTMSVKLPVGTKAA